MVSSILTVLAAATVALAGTPPGFAPASSTELIVDFGNVEINGQAVPKNSKTRPSKQDRAEAAVLLTIALGVQSQPQIGTLQKLQGTSFAVIMVDLDIPTTTPKKTTTLLHWLQTGLTQSTTSTKIGNQDVFTFTNKGNTAAAAAYLGPSPPAEIPLSHRYTQILVDTSGFQAQATNPLLTAAKTRQGFNVDQVLSQAGLSAKVVAGNFFNVTNPGPVSKTGAVDDSQDADASPQDGGYGSTSTDTSSMSMPMSTSMTMPMTAGAGAMLSPHVTLVAGLIAVATMFLRF